MKQITDEYLEAVCERAEQVGGNGRGLQYAIGFLSSTLRKFDLNESQTKVFEKDLEQLQIIIQSEKEYLEKEKYD